MGRKVPEVNSSSTADMAFLLLIFFLMTTTMNVDSGIPRVLPQMPQDDQEQEQDINQRNVLLVRVNQSNELQIGGDWSDVYELKDRVLEFILNPYNDPTLSDKAEQSIERIGNVMVSKGVVSLQNDRGTNYGTYIQIQNELTRAFNEMRETASRRYFNQSYEDLDDDQRAAINKVVPLAISEALPRTNEL